MIERVAVVGENRAGMLAALALARRVSGLRIVVVPSATPRARLFGAAEASMADVPEFLHQYLGLDVGELVRRVTPVWTLGSRMYWGPRRFFDHTFEQQVYTLRPGLRKQTGYYLDGSETWDYVGPASALMSEGGVLRRNGNQVSPAARFGYQLDLGLFERWLWGVVEAAGVRRASAPLRQVEQREGGVNRLVLEDESEVRADLYVDASGALGGLGGDSDGCWDGASKRSFEVSLPCDRVVWGGRTRREDEAIRPYYTIETMKAGWRWRVDLEGRVETGYVFSSAFSSDDEAEAELRSAESGIGSTACHRFRSGRRAQAWRGNVVAVGEAAAVVEPLQPVALSVAGWEARMLAGILGQFDREPPGQAVAQYNQMWGRTWEGVARFFALHYRFNTRVDSPFWADCREKMELGGAAPFVEHYRQVGPTGLFGDVLLDALDPFGREEYLTALVGQGVTHGKPHACSEEEKRAWQGWQREMKLGATEAIEARAALRLIRGQ